MKPNITSDCHDVSEDTLLKGHEELQPGRLAADVFRRATIMLIFIWWVSISLPLSPFGSKVRPLIADIFAGDLKSLDPVGREGVKVGRSPNGLPLLVPVIEDPRKLEVLPGEGEVLSIDWPSHSSFVPRALTANAAGSLLVVADDFNIYAGQIEGGDMVEGGLRRLRSASQSDIRLRSIRSCRALAGKALKDVALVCAKSNPMLCRLLVIVGSGKQLIECPLPSLGGPAQFSSTANHSWHISQDWLQELREEHVESIAGNYLCLRGWDKVNQTGHAFFPDIRGCAIVGTSRGRIVQMREGAADHTRLIPMRIMHQRNHPSSRGGMTLIRGMYQLALWSGYGTMSAFDVRSGRLLKEWRLPVHIKWLMVTGSAEHLFLLGVRAEKEVEIYRFPLPKELREGTPHIREDL